jgi:hypothetical protein
VVPNKIGFSGIQDWVRKRLWHPRLRVALFLVGLTLLTAALPVTACEVPAGTQLWLQLASDVSSHYSKPGTKLQAILEDDINCENELLFPAGTRVEGKVSHVQKVGWGIRHETAAIDLEFDQVLPDGTPPTDIHARVLEVGNARESVKKGVIHGIRATDTPQGRISSRLKHLPAWNPYSDMYLIVFKAAFPIFPEPEIYYGPGTDLKVELVSAVQASQNSHSVSRREFVPENAAVLDEIALSEPERTYTREDKVADVVNLAFLGSRGQVEAAFHGANWVGSDHFSKRAFVHQFAAILNETSYVRAPMMPMLLGGKPPEMTFQKSLNSYSKRDHLRIWGGEQTLGGSQIWLGAATHDVGASLSLRHSRFVHNIEADVDQERSRVIRDLRLAGCVDSVFMARRPDVPHHTLNAAGNDVITDGELAMVRLKDCTSNTETEPPHHIPSHPGTRPFRYVRNQILTFRSDIWRANIICGVYDLGRMMVTASRHPSAATAVAATPAVKISPEELTSQKDRVPIAACSQRQFAPPERYSSTSRSLATQ